MKTCPVCKARCFDDMEICYGCMFRFDGDGESGCAGSSAESESASRDAGAAEPEAVESALAGSRRNAAPKAAPARKAATRPRIPRVYGALDGGASGEDEDIPAAVGDGPVAGVSGKGAPPRPDGGAATTPASLQETLGQLASISVKEGYRLVVSVEPMK